MNIYEEMYFRLFNRVSMALEALNSKDYDKTKLILENAQAETEEMFISVIDS